MNHAYPIPALRHQWRLKNPIVINHLEIMKRAKINSRNTFGKCLHELHLQGYINYRPSFNPGCTEIDIRLLSG
jgi:Tfp pilus assembly ATPase PilU